MKKIVALIFVALFISACASPSPRFYKHPTENDQDFERDKYDCMRSAEQQAENLGMEPEVFWMYFVQYEADECLRLKYGWQYRAE